MKRSLLLLVLCLALLTACTAKPAAQTPAPAPTPAPTATPAPAPTPAPTPEPTPEPDPAAEVRAQVAEGNSLCGVLYLGFDLDTLSPDFSPEQVYALYPWAQGAPYVDALGEDVYLLVPATESVALTIQAVELSDQGELVPTGETLYSGVGEVVLLRCNVSDIMPNTLVTALESDQLLEFSPSLSLRDGSVWAPGAVDLTPYPEGFEFDRD